ncbi:MAG TPA: hypothetical protein VJV78_27160 [Polyangiales bacterium]|nr:hypothetical protein [Polyangiales bacterium]
MLLGFLALLAAHAYFTPDSADAPWILLCFGGLLLVSWQLANLSGVRRGVELAFGAPATESDPKGGRAWFVAGGCVVVCGLVALELGDAPFFLQDDNFDEFLPVMIWASRSLRSGVLPLWNPHQYLGAPVAELGMYALTYPPTYLSVWLAQSLGQVEWAIDVFAIGHLALAYVACAWAVHRAGVGAALSSAAAFCFTLCGYHLIAGRGWYYMLPVAVALPLLVGLLARWAAGPVGMWWAIAVGTCSGVHFHAGNAQMWTYCALFFVLCALLFVLSGVVPARRLAWLACGLLLAAAIASPLLVPQFSFVHGIERELFPGGDVEPRGLLAMFAPFGTVRAGHPMARVWGQTRELDFTQLYAAGSLLSCAALASCVVAFVMHLPRASRARLVWSFGTFLALLLALGQNGGLWPLLNKLPVFNAFQIPYKLLGLFNMFACLSGALMLDGWLRVSSWRRSATLGIWSWCAAVTLYGCVIPLPSNCSWNRRVYTAQPPAVHGALASGLRMLPLAPRRTLEPDPASWLAQNVASAYGYTSIEGSNPFIDALPETQRVRRALTAQPQAALEAFGVSYVYARLSRPAPAAKPWHGNWLEIVRHMPPLPLVARGERAALLSVPNPAPLVFDQSAPVVPIPFHATGEGIFADLPRASQPRAIVLNYLQRAAFVALDQHRRALPLGHDSWGRMRATVPADATHIALLYRPPFARGIALGLVLLSMFVVAVVSLSRSRLAG